MLLILVLNKIMISKNYYYYFHVDNIELINSVKTLCEKNKKEEATLGNNVIDKKKRDCSVSWIKDSTIYNVINNFFIDANKNANWNFDTCWNETMQYTVYNKKQFYSWHTDQGKEPYPKDFKEKNYAGLTRKLSMTMQLSNPSEYEGGDFCFRWLTTKGIHEEVVHDAKKLGTIIVFPSYIWHTVKPITKGTRKSLVCWQLGKPFK